MDLRQITCQRTEADPSGITLRDRISRNESQHRIRSHALRKNHAMRSASSSLSPSDRYRTRCPDSGSPILLDLLSTLKRRIADHRVKSSRAGIHPETRVAQ